MVDPFDKFVRLWFDRFKISLFKQIVGSHSTHSQQVSDITPLLKIIYQSGNVKPSDLPWTL